MKYLFQRIKDNIYNQTYYEEILVKPLSVSFGYYAKMALWLTLVYTAIISLFFLPEFVRLSRQVISDFAQNYPAQLVISFKDGIASTNMSEPIAIPLASTEKTLFSRLSQEVVINNFVTIDTRSNLSVTDFNRYQSLFVVGKDSSAGLGGEDRLQITKHPANSVSISKTDIDLAANKAQKIILTLAPIGVLLIYLLGVLFFVFTLLPILITASLAWLLLYVARRDLSFRQSLSVSLHASSLALCVNLLLFVFYPSFSINFPFLITVSLLVIYLNLIQKKKMVIAQPVAPKEIPIDTVAKEKREKEEQETSKDQEK